MPSQRGKTYNLTFAWKKLDTAISNLNGECFTSKEIHKITGVNKRAINLFLSKKTKKGLLERIRHGCYKKISDGNLTQRLPLAFVATKVWEILRQSEKPLIQKEISQIITEDTGLDLYSDIGVLLVVWRRRNVLDKFGSKKPYAYQIKPNCESRPPVSSLF